MNRRQFWPSLLSWTLFLGLLAAGLRATLARLTGGATFATGGVAACVAVGCVLVCIVWLVAARRPR